MTTDRLAELAIEAADCIEVNDLTADEIESYLHGFLAEVVAEVVTGIGQAQQPKKRRKRGRRT